MKQLVHVTLSTVTVPHVESVTGVHRGTGVVARVSVVWSLREPYSRDEKDKVTYGEKEIFLVYVYYRKISDMVRM